MESQEIPAESEPDEARSRLAEGLKNCRAVVENYRTMIANEQADLDSSDASTTPNESLPTSDSPQA